MIKIRVTKGTARVLKGTSKAGRDYELHIQQAYAYVIDRDTGEVVEIPEKFEIILPRGETQPYAAGNYLLSPASFYVDRDGRLAINPVLMRPEQARQPAASVTK